MTLPGLNLKQLQGLLSKMCIIVLSCHFISASQNHHHHHRSRRGASIYPVFGGGSSGHGGAQNSYFFLHDPTPFIQYLGGSTGSSSSRGHSSSSPSPSASSYSFSAIQPSSSSHRSSSSGGGGSVGGYSGSSFDTNALNAYTLAMSQGQARHSSSSSPSPSPSGWTPIVGGRGSSSSSSSSTGSLGYGGSFYTSDYGLLSPNFAHSNSLAPRPTTSHRPVHVPRLDAAALAAAAQTSFYAQNSLYDVLLSGSRPSTYKGSSSY